jgi:hypothetical protein
MLLIVFAINNSHKIAILITFAMIIYFLNRNLNYNEKNHQFYDYT